jgi:hypothetical protein
MVCNKYFFLFSRLLQRSGLNSESVSIYSESQLTALLFHFSNFLHSHSDCHLLVDLSFSELTVEEIGIFLLTHYGHSILMIILYVHYTIEYWIQYSKLESDDLVTSTFLVNIILPQEYFSFLKTIERIETVFKEPWIDLRKALCFFSKGCVLPVLC